MSGIVRCQFFIPRKCCKHLTNHIYNYVLANFYGKGGVGVIKTFYPHSLTIIVKTSLTKFETRI